MEDFWRIYATCDMKNNYIVLSGGGDDLVELEFGGWCRTKDFPSR